MYRRVGDRIYPNDVLKNEAEKFSMVHDSLILKSDLAEEYYCRVPFEWQSNALGKDILGIWWDKPDDPTASMLIEKGVVHYPDPMYSVRASFHGRILTTADRDGSGPYLVDTINMPSFDTLVMDNTFGSHRLYRGKDSI